MAVPLRDDAPTKRIPWITYGLILANLVVFLFLQPPGFQTGGQQTRLSGAQMAHTRLVDPARVREAERYSYGWGAIPCEVLSGQRLSEQPSTCHGHQPPRQLLPDNKVVLLALLTHMFLHGSVLHVAGNMLFLWVFGNNVEDRLGHLPFLAFYVIGGIVAALGFVLSNPHSLEPMVGASGAIAAVMGAYLVYRPRGRILVAVSTAAFQVVYVPAFVVLGLFFVTQFFTPKASHVAWQAHAAGMVFGAVVGYLLGRVFPDPFRSDATEGGAGAAGAAGTTF